MLFFCKVLFIISTDTTIYLEMNVGNISVSFNLYFRLLDELKKYLAEPYDHQGLVWASAFVFPLSMLILILKYLNRCARMHQ